MRLLRIIALCLIVGQLLILNCYGQNEPPVGYHWISANQVLLWRSAQSEEIVSASFDQSSGELTVLGAEGADWLPLLQQVAKARDKQVDLEQVSPELLWKYALTILHNEPASAKWARPRMPSVEIYFQLSAAKDKAQLGIFSNPTPRVLANFTLNGSMWNKPEDVKLGQLLKSEPNSSELSKILPIASSGKLPSDKTEWKQFWDSWIKYLATQPYRPRQVMYRDSDKQLGWCWIERLKDDAEFPAVARKMSATEPALTLPDLPHVSSKPSSQISYWWLLLFIGVLLIVFSVVAARMFPGEMKRLVKGLRPGSNSKETEVKPPTIQTALRTNTLDEIFTIVNKKIYAQNELQEKTLRAQLEWVHSEYMTVATSEDLVEEDAELRSRAVEEHYKKEFDLTPAESAKIKKWINIGRVAESSIVELLKFQIPKEVLDQLPPKAFTSKSSAEEDWQANWPEVIRAFDKNLKARIEECVELKKQLNKLPESVEAEKKTLRREHETELREKDDAIKNQKDLLGAESQARESAENEVRNLKAKVDQLSAQLKERAQLEQNVREALATHNAREKDLETVEQLSIHLRSWLQQYYSTRKSDPENRVVALLGTLMNYSLYQLCFSIIFENQSALRDPTVYNLLLLIRTFQGHVTSQPDNRETFKLLKRIAPEAESNVKKQVTGKPGTDGEQLFKGLLKWLKAETNTEFSTFYIGLDNEQHPTVVQVS